MKFSLISLGGIILTTDELKSLTVSTSEGVLTILPGHMPLAAAVTPCVLKVHHGKHTEHFALGGGVLQTDGKEISIIADMVENNEHDVSEIQKRKTEAAALMAEYRAKWDQVSMEALIELEQEYMKDTAREQLAGARH